MLCRILLVILCALFWSPGARAQNAVSSTSPPSYSTGNNSLSQTLSGGLRVQPQDGAGNDVSASHPLPVDPTGVTAIAPVVSASLENAHVLKNAPGRLYSVYAANLTGGTVSNLLILNATSAPVDGAVTPIVCVPFNSNGVASANYQGIPPASFSTGITAVVSSAASCFTKTTGVTTAFISGLVP